MTAPRLSTATGVLAATLLLALAACSSTASPASPTVSTAPTGGGPTSGTPAPRTPPSSSSTTPSGPAPATEYNPPGDIPDNQVFVKYRPPGSTVTIQVPEGWARSTHAGTVTFTDHFNSVGIAERQASTAPTVRSAMHQDVPAIKAAQASVKAVHVSMITRAGQHAVLITYQADSKPDPVTNKVVVDAVEVYEFFHQGHEAVLTLTGPSGADNVDPWRTVSESLAWS